MSRGRYLALEYRSRRGWRREVTRNRHGLAHLAVRAVRVLDDQIATGGGYRATSTAPAPEEKHCLNALRLYLC